MRKVSARPKKSSSASGKRDVAQLGQQAKQSISPLKVLPTNQGLAADIAAVPAHMRAAFAADAGISLTQLEAGIDGGDMGPMLEVVWPWIYGESLVPPDQINRLPTQMRILHDWYLQVIKEDQRMIHVKITEEHFIGKDEMTIDFEELYQLYKLDALDLTIISTYCL